MGTEQKLACVVCMSGYLPNHAQFRLTKGLETTPVFHGHGTQDPLVRYDMATRTLQKLKDDHGLSNYELKSYPIVHTVSHEEIQDVQQFLMKILPNDDKYKI